VNNPFPTASSISGSSDRKVVDGAQALRTGLELARASQLTMLRLQLALHKANRCAAMQALDHLLDIDAEMEGIAVTLIGVAPHLAEDAALSSFIGLQKTAIAVEKHVLTGSGQSSDGTSSAIAPPSDWAGAADLPAQLLLLDEEVELDDRAGSRRWMHVLAVVIVVIFIGFGLIAYLWPTLSFTVVSF
jgi:hypothetical protein